MSPTTAVAGYVRALYINGDGGEWVGARGTGEVITIG